MRTGVRLGLDVGTVRIGVAASDPSGALASPVETLARDRHGSDVARLRSLVGERACIEVVVGRPRSLSGRAGPAERSVREYARRLAGAVAPVPVRLVDERFSTVSATGALAASGTRGKAARRRVDAAAAAIILQGALDWERSNSRPPGEAVIRDA